MFGPCLLISLLPTVSPILQLNQSGFHVSDIQTCLLLYPSKYPTSVVITPASYCRGGDGGVRLPADSPQKGLCVLGHRGARSHGNSVRRFAGHSKTAALQTRVPPAG